MISYAGLLFRLSQNHMTRTALGRELKISSRTMARIGRGEKVADRVLQRMASYFHCPVSELCWPVSENPLLQRMQEEKSIGLSGSLYHEVQIHLTYHSSHMEGNRLSEEQTRMIFETNSLAITEIISVDDILETCGHFRAIDYCIDRAEEPLSEEFIKELHALLKQGTRDAARPWSVAGEYKKIPNRVGNRETAAPEETAGKMHNLLTEYEKISTPGIMDIIAFHQAFECIHPFQDGNGRVGRLIAFKECLRHGITPFIIEDSKKMSYFQGLSEWESNSSRLTDACLEGQETFQKLMSLFGLK